MIYVSEHVGEREGERRERGLKWAGEVSIPFLGLIFQSKEKMKRGSRRGCIRLKRAIIGIDDEDDCTFTIRVDNRIFHFQGNTDKPLPCHTHLLCLTLLYTKSTVSEFLYCWHLQMYSNVHVEEKISSVMCFLVSSFHGYIIHLSWCLIWGCPSWGVSLCIISWVGLSLFVYYVCIIIIMWRWPFELFLQQHKILKSGNSGYMPWRRA